MRIRKSLSTILAICLLMLGMGFEAPRSAQAASNATIQYNLDIVMGVYPDGSYFSRNGAACGGSHGACENCKLQNVPARGTLPAGNEVGADTSWTCVGFGKYVFYCLTGTAWGNSGNTVYTNIPYNQVYQYASLGDYVSYSGHAGIYISGDSSGYYMYEANYTYTNRVRYKGHKHTNGPCKIVHAANYNNPRRLDPIGEVHFSFTDDTTDTSRRVVGETTATMASTISITNGSINSVTQVGMDLYDANGNYITTGTDEGGTLKPKNGVINAWYNINPDPNNQDIQMSLTKGTTYRYRFWAKYGGQTYYGDFKSFTTTTTESILDLNGMLNGASSGSIADFGTADVYINGSLVANDVADYYASHPVGTSWEIRDIRALDGCYYDGIYSGGTSGTIGNERIDVVLEFERPGKPSLTVEPGSSIAETTLSWSAADRTTHYDVRIYDASGACIFANESPAYRQIGADRLFYRMPLSAGSYSATVSATNVEKSAWTSSDRVSFTVANASAGEVGESAAWREVNHKLFVVYEKDCDWLEAEAIAANNAGTFASITSAAEQNAVAAAVAEFGHTCWLGAQRGRNNKWEWNDGSAFSYTNWEPGQPSDAVGTENYLQMVYVDGTWNDKANFGDSSSDRYDVKGYVVKCEPISVMPLYIGGTVPAGTTLTKDDLTVMAAFENGIMIDTTDFTITQSGTTAGEQTVTVTYGPVSDTFTITVGIPMDTPDLVLPAGLQMIDSEAFYGIKARVVKCPEGLEEIGSNAFGNCKKLRQIYIPETTITISRTAFTGCTDLVIYGIPGSPAETFANARGFEFREYTE